MHTVGIHEAKTHLSKLLQEVLLGREVLITKGGRPIARLVGAPVKGHRVPGKDRGKVKLAKDFGKFPRSVLKEFYKDL